MQALGTKSIWKYEQPDGWTTSLLGQLLMRVAKSYILAFIGLMQHLILMYTNMECNTSYVCEKYYIYIYKVILVRHLSILYP